MTKLLSGILPLACGWLFLTPAVAAYEPAGNDGGRIEFAMFAGKAASAKPSKPSPTTDPAPAPAPTVLEWTEKATWTSYDSQLSLRWMSSGGDVGGQVASLSLIDDNKAGWHEVIIPPGGTDFIVKRTGGTNFQFSSREGANPPQFVLADGTVLTPSADCTLSSSTTQSLCASTKLATSTGFLIRFNTTQAGRLRLYSDGTGEYGNQTLTFSRVKPYQITARRPEWLSVDPTEVYTYENVKTISLQDPDLTWLSTTRAIPPQAQACVTVYQKLHSDFRPGDGGKLPGLSNTGQATKDAVKTAWGGRAPDGVHWSARSGFGGWNDTHIARRTYFYAMSPHNSYGYIDPMPVPISKGQFEAYVQCVKLNDAGVANGGLYYETASQGPIFARDDIRWRDVASPESLIRELWIDYYCGGTSCGTGPRGTITFVRAVVTKGMPDMAAVRSEVARLNKQ